MVRLLAIFILLCAIAPAQNPTTAKLSYKLISIHVKGANRLTPEQIINASGLTIGQLAGEKEFKASAEKLGNTGLFTQLTYSYQYSSAGCNLDFQVTENDSLVPIIFDNFVWFTDAELLASLRAKLALFTGTLPLGGDFADQVAATLNAILADHKISGTTNYDRAGALNGPVDSYLYRVNSRKIVIRDFEFPGASPAELDALQTAGKPLVGREYFRTRMRYQEKLTFLPVLQSRGYLKAQFAEPQLKVAEDTSQTLVDVSLPVTAGQQYRLTEIQFAGNTVFTSEKLQDLIKIKAGEPANGVELSSDVEAIQKLYGTKGYLFAQVAPQPELDDSQSTVRYEFEVNEGSQFRMGQLIIDGLDEAATKQMAAQWQMKTGDPFDASYMTKFFKVMYRDIGLRGSWSVVPKQSVSEQDRTVSVTLHFMPKA